MSERILQSRRICVLDGRYRKNVAVLEDIVSEFALMQRRAVVEIKYFIAVAPYFDVEASPFKDKLISLYELFSEDDYDLIKVYEDELNHDVMAVVKWLQTKAAE